MGARPNLWESTHNNGGAPSSCGRFGDFLLFFMQLRSARGDTEMTLVRSLYSTLILWNKISKKENKPEILFNPFFNIKTVTVFSLKTNINKNGENTTWGYILLFWYICSKFEVLIYRSSSWSVEEKMNLYTIFNNPFTYVFPLLPKIATNCQCSCLAKRARGTMS